ncbi:hypothetical protein [Dongia sp. agr-C8]
MARVLRIGSSSNIFAAAAGGGTPPDIGKQYLDRLVKLIPSEVIGLYLAGKSIIQAKYDPKQPIDPAGQESSYWIGWTAACFLAVIFVRWWATRDPDPANPKPAQKGAIAIAAISFLCWIYTLGDLFGRVWTDLSSPVLGALLVLVWTFLVPFFYKGDDA